MASFEGAPQPVVDGGVDDIAGAETVPESGLRQDVRAEIHVLHAACHNHRGVAGPDLRSSQNVCFEARAADAVDRGCARRIREARRQRGDARWRLARARLDHLAHEDFVDGTLGQESSLHGGPDCDAPERGGGNLGEAASELPDRCAGGRDEEDIPVGTAGHRHDLPIT